MTKRMAVVLALILTFAVPTAPVAGATYGLTQATCQDTTKLNGSWSDSPSGSVCTIPLGRTGQIPAGDTLQLASATQLMVAGSLTLQAGGVLILQGGALWIDGTFTNEGAVTHGSNIASQALYNHGTLTNRGQITVLSGCSLANSGNFLNEETASITVHGYLQNTLFSGHSGSFTNNGTVDLFNTVAADGEGYFHVLTGTTAINNNVLNINDNCHLQASSLTNNGTITSEGSLTGPATIDVYDFANSATGSVLNWLYSTFNCQHSMRNQGAFTNKHILTLEAQSVFTNDGAFRNDGILNVGVGLDGAQLINNGTADNYWRIFLVSALSELHNTVGGVFTNASSDSVLELSLNSDVWNSGLIEHKNGVIRGGSNGNGAIVNYEGPSEEYLGTLNKYCPAQITLPPDRIVPGPTDVCVGTIVIQKDTVPNWSTDFSFSSGLGAFSLDDDADATLPNERTFSGQAPGSYAVTEGAAASHTLSALVCVDPDGGSTVNLGTRTATIDVDAYETITCTFTNSCVDGDSDGYGSTSCGGTDCNDGNAAVHPGATELCNGVDDDCDGSTDEGVLGTFYRDADNDGYGNAAVSTQGCAAPTGYVSNSADCNDGNVAVHPGATEVCNGADDDCDGSTDEGVATTYYQDSDLDGYGNAGATTEACTQPTGYVTNSTDCNDSSAAVHPGAAEVCNGVDDDCDGSMDEGVATTYYQDADGDGYGTPFVTTQACTTPAGYVADGTDCDDDLATIHPGATEVCNGYDDDCDSQIDEGVQTYFYRDADGDTYGNPGVVLVGCTQPMGYVTDYTDCNDSSAAVHPGATEVCNGADDDCDASIDEGATTTFYRDADLDGYGNASVTTQACTAPTGYVANSEDCNDSEASINPVATETCNSRDDDCDSLTDEGVTSTFYQDADGDGYGADSPTAQACAEFPGYVADSTDCNDANASVNPGATDVCNAVDDDCDGSIDEGVTTTFYRDADLDGYGNASVTSQACTAPTGYVSNSTDCNDSLVWMHPGATEVCNGMDDDCDGSTDEGVTNTYYQDADHDGYGDAGVSVQACTAPSFYVSDSTDCDDSNDAVYPGASEGCNGIDDDCDGQIDEDVKTTFYGDADGDGYGNASVTTQACCAGYVDRVPDNAFYRDVDGETYGTVLGTMTVCTPPSGYVTDNTDCDDGNASVYPGAMETCNGIDDDCNSSVDEGVKTAFYVDSDSDGYGNADVSTEACTAPAGYVVDNTDCDDGDGAVHPGATEACNGVDDDCDGSVDQGVKTTFYVDSDSDGYGNADVSTEACAAPSGYVTNSTDCADGNAAVHPGATEACNGIDDDCDGSVDEGVQTTYYQDADGDGYGNAATGTQACTQPSGYVTDSADCNDSSATVYPGAAEVCNGVDDDCDVLIDDGADGPPTTCGVGACAGDGVMACLSGSLFNTCVPGTPGTEAGNEACSNGVDDDCDGLTDAADADCLGTIIVDKVTAPAGGVGLFTFSGDAAGTIGDGGQIVVSGLAAGTYTATEADPGPDYGLLSIACSDGNSSGDVGTRMATFQLESSETVKCTFTNGQRGLAVSKGLVFPSNGLLGIDQVVRFLITVENTGGAAMGPIGLRDEFEPSCLLPRQAEEAPDGQSNSAGYLEWNDIGTLAAGQKATLWVEFTAQNECAASVNTAIASVGALSFQGQATVRIVGTIARLSGFVYHDETGGGVREPGAEGIADAEVLSNGLSYTTNTSGWWSFNMAAPGSYVVETRTTKGWWLPTTAQSCSVNVANSWEQQTCDFGYWWGLRGPDAGPVVSEAEESFGAVQDTVVSAWAPGVHGEDANLWVRQPGVSSSLLQFEVSGLPEGAEAAWAELRLYSTGGSNGNRLYLTVYEVTEPWAEGLATWPEPEYGEAVGWAWVDEAGWVVIALEPSGVLENEYGYIVRGEGDAGRQVEYRFLSSEYVNVTLQPQLLVGYDIVQ